MLVTKKEYLQTHSIHNTDSLFQAYCEVLRRCPQAPAINAPDGLLTYAELDQASNQVLHFLSPGMRVGIFVNPSKAFAILIVACMKANSLAILLDPGTSNDVLSQTNDLDLCIHSNENTTQVKTFAVDSLNFDQLTTYATPPQRRLTSFEYPGLHQLISSGSSGQATRANISREAMWVHVKEMNAAYGYQADVSHANLTRHTTAAGLHGFWRILLRGACFLFTDLKRESFHQVYQRLQRAQVQTLQSTPSILYAFAQSCSSFAKLSSVQQVIFGGEATTSGVLREIYRLFEPECRAAYNYSSTEAMQISVYCATFKEFLEYAKIPMGQVFQSREVRILDEQQRPLPIGQVGEIVVRSAFLALEIQGPNQEQRLQRDPQDPKFKLYFTGDLGRWHPNGYLEHWGRKDRQIKINGVRIDPALIESACENIPGVKRAIVVTETNPEEALQLALCVQRDPSLASDAFIYSELAKRLPVNWLPHRIHTIAQFPLMPTGKVNYRQLVSQLEARPSIASPPQSNNTDQTAIADIDTWLKNIWAELLGVNIDSEQASFRASGGDSLKALRLLARLTEHGFPDLSPAWLIQNDRFEQQSQALKQESRLILTSTDSLSCSSATPNLTHPVIPDVLERDWVRQRIGWV